MYIRRLVLGSAMLVAAAAIATGQDPSKTPLNLNPPEGPLKITKEKDDVFKRWLTEDVPYIITPAERKAFQMLTTNEERENFIKIFWDNRDPDRETEENEYREEYYQRIAYANENYASGIPGWRTDRGRIYIAWGKPDSVESRPTGGAYDRPIYEGGGSTTTYPFETWFYRHLDGVGDGIEIEFVDRTGTGEYKIAGGSDDKDALAMTPSTGRRHTDAGSGTYQREQDNPFSILARNIALQNPPALKYGDLNRALTDSPVIDNDPLAFDMRIDYFRQSDERVITTFTIQTDNNQLKFEQSGGLPTATLNILGRITTVSNKRGGIFEDAVITQATVDELANTKQRNSIYQRAVALAPGIYKVDVIVRDVGTGNKGIVRMGFTVPKYEEKKLSTSSLVLAAKLRPAGESDNRKQFVIGDLKIIPNISGSFKTGQEVGVYMQVYNAGVDQTTLRPAIDVSYVLLKDGKEILRQTEDWSTISDSGQRLTLARLLPTADLAPGEYEVKVQTKDRVSGQTIENGSKFTIAK
ncbi:MAG: GWxTD domain-containing protein [Pyrinomonadaceae bacterium]|nr:GWxTD domain-containing protein [Acidobacteriota bacterium]MBP7375451.1 GWxTD domain-containing protein [Pyrinomonadaceae bacterium]